MNSVSKVVHAFALLSTIMISTGCNSSSALTPQGGLCGPGAIPLSEGSCTGHIEATSFDPSMFVFVTGGVGRHIGVALTVQLDHPLLPAVAFSGDGRLFVTPGAVVAELDDGEAWAFKTDVAKIAVSPKARLLRAMGVAKYKLNGEKTHAEFVKTRSESTKAFLRAHYGLP